MSNPKSICSLSSSAITMTKECLSTSRIRHLCSSNEAPGDDERDLLLRVRAEENRRRAEIVRRIDEATRQIDTLEAERNGLVRKRDCLDSLLHIQNIILSPVRQLPADILREIFMVCVEQEALRRENMVHLWKMSWVCRFWRTVALDTPMAWSYIGVHNSSRRLKLQLERARQCSLSVSILSNAHLDILLPTSRRWKALYINIPAQDFDALLPITNALPYLEVLHIRLEDYTCGTLSRQHREIFENTPVLHTLIGQYEQLNMFRLPWHQIADTTYMRCTSFCENEVDDGVLGMGIQGMQWHLDFLRKVPRLETCALTRRSRGRDACTSSDKKTVECPSLRKVSLTEFLDGEAHACKILNYLRLPNLEELNIYIIMGRISCALFTDFIARSQCNIVRLRFTSNTHSNGDIVELLKVLPTLEYVHVTATSLEDLRRVFGETGFLPKLKRLLVSVKVEVDEEILEVEEELRKLRPDVAGVHLVKADPEDIAWWTCNT